jgi:hypothetical protein
LLTSNVEGRRRGQQEEVNGSVVLFLLFLSTLCMSCPHVFMHFKNKSFYDSSMYLSPKARRLH